MVAVNFKFVDSFLICGKKHHSYIFFLIIDNFNVLDTIFHSLQVCKKDRNTGETLNGGMADGVQFTYDMSSGETIVGYSAGTMGEM